MAVETTISGELPEVVRLPQADVYIGASDSPAPAIEHLYVRAEDLAGWVIYQHQQSVEPLWRRRCQKGARAADARLVDLDVSVRLRLLTVEHDEPATFRVPAVRLRVAPYEVMRPRR